MTAYSITSQARWVVAPKPTPATSSRPRMEAIDSELRRLGIGDLLVAVAAGNDAAASFYERRGFSTRLNVLLGPVSLSHPDT